MEGVEVVYPEGSEIVKPGDPSTSIYVVTQGSARMVLESPTSTGKMSSVLRLLGPGDLFGLGPALDGRPYVAGLQSMTETRVLVVSRESFLRELEDHPAACRGLLGQFGEMVRACESWIISLL
jgi:CRP-like cAMP-binding protein